MMVAAEQPSGLDDGVSHSSACLVEHQAFDRAELCAVAAVDAHVLNAITGHQGMRHGVLPVFLSFPRHYSTNAPGMRASDRRGAPRAVGFPVSSANAATALCSIFCNAERPDGSLAGYRRRNAPNARGPSPTLVSPVTFSSTASITLIELLSQFATMMRR